MKTGQAFVFDRDEALGDATRANLPHREIFVAVEPGTRLLVDDGKLVFRVIAASADRIETKVEVGGTISNNKGLNVPDVVLPLAALTEKDRADLAFALDQHVDWIALSFVQRPEDVAEARRLIGGKANLLAKIEKPAAIDRLEGILELADAVMVARGDLGVEMPPEEVPPLQKRIVEAARRMGRPVVVATQMLESMISSPSPTRAEVSDVATAVYDGADAIMLSAESASGQYPGRGGRDDEPDRDQRRIRSQPLCPRPFHRDPARRDHQRRHRAGGERHRAHRRRRRDRLLHQLGLDRAAGGARAADRAVAGADALAQDRAAARPAVGRACGAHPRRRTASRRWSANRSGWRCATASPGPATASSSPPACPSACPARPTSSTSPA